MHRKRKNSVILSAGGLQSSVLPCSLPTFIRPLYDSFFVEIEAEARQARQEQFVITDFQLVVNELAKVEHLGVGEILNKAGIWSRRYEVYMQIMEPVR